MIWGISSQKAYQSNYSDYAAGQSAQDARQEIEAVCTRELTPGGYIECAERVLGTERDNRRSDYDLQAQQNMAQWAAIMAAIGGVQAVIGAVGLYLIVGTFRQTAAQAHAAQRGVASNTRANIIARDAATEATRIANESRRAWVGFESVTISPEARVDANQVHVNVTVALKNYGHTPAHSVWFHTAIYADGQAIQAYREETDPIAPRFIGSTIFPGTTRKDEFLSTIARPNIESYIEGVYPPGFFSEPDKLPVGLCVLVHVRYRIDGDDRVHDTGQYYPISGAGADGRWFRHEGNHPIHVWDVRMSVNPSPWAT
jgi:hypothetical protein